MAISWIQRELVRKFPKADLRQGVDLNGDGKISGTERLQDSNRNKQLGDPVDWLAFYKKNKPALVKLGGFFEWGQKFNPENPLQDILSIEHDVTSEAHIRGAFQYIGVLLDSTRKEKGTPQELVAGPLIKLRRFGYTTSRFLPGATHLLSGGINNSKLDCDSASFFTYVVGFELGWKLEIVNVPQHTYLRWNDPKTKQRFNFDLGDFNPDELYRIEYHLDRTGVYPMVLNRDGILAQIFYNDAMTLIDKRDYARAMSYMDQAIELNPNDPAFHNGKAVLLNQLQPGNTDAILQSCDKAIRLNPIHLNAHLLRASILLQRKAAPQALAELKPLLQYFPQDKSLHQVLAAVYNQIHAQH